MAIPFDTYEAIQHLTAAGFTEPQAHALSDLLKQAAIVSAEHLVTKADLAEAVGTLRAEIATVRGEVGNVRWIALACFGVLLSIAYKVWF
jgi:hypothetical protein